MKSIRTDLDRATPENVKLAFSGAFTATGKADFELFH